MKDKQQSYFVSIGSSSLLVIFLVLCLATFAILSLSSASSDYSFSRRLGEHKQTYYDASARAETIVDEIDSLLYGITADTDRASQENSDQSASFSEYLADVGTVLEGREIEGVLLQLDISKDEGAVSFRVPSGEQQELFVALEIMDYRKYANYYKVKTWKTVNVGDWESGETLKLIR